ncbi:catalase [Stigmatella sp. ncwal1]|uniref:Catalase n=1 Tax=Stigmatella ashevillensis TaxID=2995309 RepID=A0ABT5D2M8_9BACT|nr:catalase [Stigmatella ashevillena]MDC0707921.1 catalase [Stigmatella ashevillena]
MGQFNSEQAAIASLLETFVGVMARRHVALDSRVYRPVFLKPQGTARGVFRIRQDLPMHLRVGVFAHKEFPAWVRFSGDVVPQGSDLANNTLGLGIKLLGVPGTKLLEGEEGALTHDFVLQNHDVFFANDAQEFAEFSAAALESDAALAQFLATHPRAAGILQEMASKQEESLLLTHFFSAVPYAFGDRVVKYAVRPSHNGGHRSPTPAGDRGPDYLRRDLRKRLLKESASFDFFLQLQTDPVAMPIEKATVRWSESLSPFIPVATLELAKQDIDQPSQQESIDNLSFTGWHALPEHSPVGGVNRARRAVYKASADYRRRRNHVPLGEPIEAIRPR